MGGSEQNHPKEKEKQDRKWLPEEALLRRPYLAEKRKEKKRRRRKGKIYPTEGRIPKNSKKK